MRTSLRLLIAGSVLAGTTALPVSGPTWADPTPSISPSISPSASSNDEAPLHVDVTQLLPKAPRPGDALQIVGRVTNIGSKPITNVTVRLALGEKVTTRGELANADRDRPRTYYGGRAQTPSLGDLAPGKSVAFDLRTLVDQLPLGATGAYPVDVQGRGRFGGGNLELLGLAPTWLPWFGRQLPGMKTRIAVVWPLVDQPRRADELMLDDELATSLAPNGRLGRLLATARAVEAGQCDGAARGPDPVVTPAPTRCEPTPVTYVVDPDLLYTVNAMTSSYKVKDGAGTRPGTGTAAATAWLQSLQATTNQVVALPYADPDINAVTRDSNNRNDVATSAALGSDVVGALLRRSPLKTVAWPPAGAITPAASDALAGLGATNFLLDEEAFQQSSTPPRFTQDARTTLPPTSSGRQLSGLVVDNRLSELLTGMLTSQLGPRLAEQRFLVETALVAAERPSLARTFVLAPPRRGDVMTRAAAAAVRDIGRIPWLCPVQLSTTAAGTEQCAGEAPPALPRISDRGDLRTDSTGELGADYLAKVAADRNTAAQITDSVIKPEASPPFRGRFQRAVARAQSSAWRANSPGALVLATRLHATVTDLRGRILVIGKPLLLTNTKGTLTVSLENTLDVPVTVAVQFSSQTASLSTTQTPLLTIGPGSSQQPTVKATARRSGQFVVVAQLLDRQGAPFGVPAEVIVRSTRYGRFALAVTGLGVAVLLTAAGVRIVRRAMRKT